MYRTSEKILLHFKTSLKKKFGNQHIWASAQFMGLFLTGAHCLLVLGLLYSSITVVLL